MNWLARARARLRHVPSAEADAPTVFHVTHHKAGSQWVYALLSAAAPDRIVPPEPGMRQLLERPVRPGGVYPTVYLPRPDFEAIGFHGDARGFVVLRDLRDTLVSLYFSQKHSHPLLTPALEDLRHRLQTMDEESGLLLLLDRPGMQRAGRVHTSWTGGPYPVFRFEDLVRDGAPAVGRVLAHAGIDLTPERLQRLVEECSFERHSGGRRPGEEDVTSHFRKGMVGDWRNHFTPRVTDAFKARFGEALALSGYDAEPGW